MALRLTGWNLYVKDGNRTRNFTVAEPERAKSENLVLARVPGATVIYGNVLPNEVMAFLKDTLGAVREWVSIDGQPIQSPEEKIEALKNAPRT